MKENTASHENEQNHLATTTLDFHLKKEEREVLYYISGYILFSLKRKYSKLSGTKTKMYRLRQCNF